MPLRNCVSLVTTLLKYQPIMHQAGRGLLLKARLPWDNKLELRSCFVVLRRWYRVKAPEMDGARKWMLQVKKKTGKPARLTREAITDMMEKIELLQSHGCYAAQLLEAPQVIHYDDDEIGTYIDCLKAASSQQLISIPLLAIAAETDPCSLISKIEQYLTTTSGFPSVADYWANKFGCNMEDMLVLIEKNQHFSAVGSIRSLTPKFDLLVERGATVDHIRKHCYVIGNRGLRTLDERSKELIELGIVNPLPLQWISQAEPTYQAMLLKFRQAAQDKRDPAKDAESIRALQMGNRKEKWDFLIDEGFTAREIMDFPRILNVNLEKLIKTYNEMKDVGMEDIKLRQITYWARFGSVATYRYRNVTPWLRNILGGQSGRTESHHLLRLQNPSVLLDNYNFLLRSGFTKDAIIKLPVILGHDSFILQNRWKAVMTGDNELTEKWKGNDDKLLNLLQYSIEKDVNFQFPVVFEVPDKCSDS